MSTAAQQPAPLGFLFTSPSFRRLRANYCNTLHPSERRRRDVARPAWQCLATDCENLSRPSKLMADEIVAAVKQDTRKPEGEIRVTELLNVTANIERSINNLDEWMKPVEVVPSQNKDDKARLVYEARGICLILGPWNFPLELVLGPLAAAIAAGNCCIVKPQTCVRRPPEWPPGSSKGHSRKRRLPYLKAVWKLEFRAKVKQNLYRDDGGIKKENIAQIVNDQNFARIKKLFDDALAKGAKVAVGGTLEGADRTIHPTMLTDVTPDMLIMQEEIFGPIVPILTYKKIDEAIEYIAGHGKPWALYIFSNNRHNIDNILNRTSSGGVTINGFFSHYLENRLPFGGVNQSGMGSYHGVFGFKAFSHERAIYIQENR